MVIAAESRSNESTTSNFGEEVPPPVLSVKMISKREKAGGIIISPLVDAPLRFVMDVDCDPKLMLELLDSRYASNRKVFRIAVQTQIFRMSYTAQNMSSYVDQHTSLFSQL